MKKIINQYRGALTYDQSSVHKMAVSPVRHPLVPREGGGRWIDFLMIRNPLWADAPLPIQIDPRTRTLHIVVEQVMDQYDGCIVRKQVTRIKYQPVRMNLFVCNEDTFVWRFLP